MSWKVYCLFPLVFTLLICYLHCYCTIQIHVEFNSMDQLHAFYRSTQRQIQDPINLCVGAFLQANKCTSEVFLFLCCQNDILSTFVYFDSCIATIKFNMCVPPIT